MRRDTFALCLLLALGASAPGAGAKEGDVKPRVNGEIRGRVSILVEHHAVTSADVFLLGTSLRARPSDDGVFRIENVPPGVYTVVAFGFYGGAVEVKGVVVSWDETTHISFPIALHEPPRWGSIERMVIDIGDGSHLVEMLEGTVEPRLPLQAVEFERGCKCGKVVEETVYASGPYRRYPWSHGPVLTWEDMREDRAVSARLTRAAATWSEARRPRVLNDYKSP